MKAIVMLLVLASVSFAQRPHEKFVLIESDGSFGISINGFENYGCIFASGMNLNNFVFEVVSSKWQRRKEANDSWADVPETIGENQICGLSNPSPGEYRWVALIWEYSDVYGAIKENIASNNTLVVAGDSESAVETVTWGLVKSSVKGQARRFGAQTASYRPVSRAPALNVLFQPSP